MRKPKPDPHNIRAKTPEEWKKKAKQLGVLIDCRIRQAKIHQRHCEFMQKYMVLEDPDKENRFSAERHSENPCNHCPVVLKKLQLDNHE